MQDELASQSKWTILGCADAILLLRQHGFTWGRSPPLSVQGQQGSDKQKAVFVGEIFKLLKTLIIIKNNMTRVIKPLVYKFVIKQFRVVISIRELCSARISTSGYRHGQ
jgi:hypothetical protein